MNEAPGPDELNFEALFAVTASAYIVLDLDLTLVAVNDSYLGATRKVRGALVGRHSLLLDCSWRTAASGQKRNLAHRNK